MRAGRWAISTAVIAAVEGSLAQETAIGAAIASASLVGFVLAQGRSGMNRFVVGFFIVFAIVATLPTSASAFRCLARGTNGVSTWGYGLIASRAQHFAVRHCRTAGGINCRIVYCR
jgi:hypothetical protein